MTKFDSAGVRGLLSFFSAAIFLSLASSFENINNRNKWRLKIRVSQIKIATRVSRFEHFIQLFVHDTKQRSMGLTFQGRDLKVSSGIPKIIPIFEKKHSGKNGGKKAATTYRVALDLRRVFIGSTQRWKTEGSGVSAFISRGQ